MKRVSVLLTKYSDWISCLLFYLGGRGYTHISLSLDEDKYYSFNYRGFCIETTEKHRLRGVHKSLSYQIAIPGSTYQDIQRRIQEFQRQKAKYRYTRMGLLCAVLQIPFHWKDHYICSQFVAELLDETGAVPLRKEANLYLPNQLCIELEGCSGLLEKKWNPI